VGSIVSENRKNLMLFSGRAYPQLAEEIGEVLGVDVTPTTAYDFAGGETFVRYTESVRGSDAFIVQSISTPVNKWFMEALLMIDAAKRGSAKRITVVLPFYPYARQDKKHRGREPISARLIADLLKTAGANRILTVDLHTAQIQGFFDGPVDHLFAMDILATYVESAYGDHQLTVVAPDSGRVRVAERWTDRLGGCPLAFIHKTRDITSPNQVVANRVIGEVAGRTCVIVDDMIDTAGTICKAADILFEGGASGRHRGHDARCPLRPRDRAPQEQPHPRGDRDQHPSARAGQAVRQAHGALDRTPARPRHPRSLRRRLRHHPFWWIKLGGVQILARAKQRAADRLEGRCHPHRSSRQGARRLHRRG
jgi:ribose-phosphate pyrophosphokinase